LVKIFKVCPNRSDWHLTPPTSKDVWDDEYLAKRKWTGYLIWINSLVVRNFYPNEDNPVEDLQKNIAKWEKYYNTFYTEEAIRMWCAENCMGRWDKFFIYGVEFEKEEDAVLFKFTWCL